MGLEAAELARWTRFAAKGGIGKCTAICDCVAESADDLMFLKDDEITVLLQLPDKPGYYLGYCEGVVGRFSGVDVHFHAKLKKPVMTKRSSSHSRTSKSLAGVSKSPTQTTSKSSSANPPGSGPSPSVDEQSRSSSRSQTPIAHSTPGSSVVNSPTASTFSRASSSVGLRNSTTAELPRSASSRYGGHGSRDFHFPSVSQEDGQAIATESIQAQSFAVLGSNSGLSQHQTEASQPQTDVEPIPSTPPSSPPKKSGHVPSPLNLESPTQNGSRRTAPLRISKRGPTSPPATGNTSPMSQQSLELSSRSSFASLASGERKSLEPPVPVNIVLEPVYQPDLSLPSIYTQDDSKDEEHPSISAPPSALDTSLTVDSGYDDLERNHPDRFSRFSIGPSLAMSNLLGMMERSPGPKESTDGEREVQDTSSSLEPPLPIHSRRSPQPSLTEVARGRISEETLASTQAQVGIGLSLLQDLVGGMGSDSDSESDYDESPRKQAWTSENTDGRVESVVFGPTSQLASGARVSVAASEESTVEGLAYGQEDDDHTDSPQSQHFNPPATYIDEDPLTPLFGPLQSQHEQNPAHLSPTTSPTTPQFPPPFHDSNFANFVQRQRRPSLAQSVLSGTSGASVSARSGASSSWDADIYDNYRYSRFSMANGATGNGRPSLDSVRTRTDSTGQVSRKRSESSTGLGQEVSFDNVLEDMPPLAARDAPTNPPIEKSHLRDTSVASMNSVYTQNSRSSPEPISPQALGDQASGNTSLRPPPLTLSEDPSLSSRSPLLHTNWSLPSPTSSTLQTAIQPLSSVTETLHAGLVEAESSVQYAMLSPRMEQHGVAGNSLDTPPVSPGLASTLRQKVEWERKSPLPQEDLDDTREVEEPGNKSSWAGDPSFNGNIVADDSEELPSKIEGGNDIEDCDDEDDTFVERVLPQPEPTRKLSTDSSSPEPQTALGRLAPLVVANRTPSPAGRDDDDKDRIVSETTSSTVVSEKPPSPEVNPPNEVPVPSPAQAPPSQLRTQTLAPNFAGRRSIFQPHPNAPKPIVASPTTPDANQPQTPPYQVTQGQPPPPTFRAIRVQEVMQMAASAPPRILQGPPGRPPIQIPPTIYGQTQVDLFNSYGPVPIMFTLEPRPMQPRATAPGGFLPAIGGGPERTNTTGGNPRQRAIAQPTPQRSGPPLRADDLLKPTEETNPEPSPNPQPQNEKPANPPPSNAPIPRSNFTPQAAGLRPRSRSFSGFNSEESKTPPKKGPSDDLSTRTPRRTVSSSVSVGSLKTPSSKPPVKSSPLRPSPLSISATNLDGRDPQVRNEPAKSPLSPKAPSHNPPLPTSPTKPSGLRSNITFSPPSPTPDKIPLSPNDMASLTSSSSESSHRSPEPPTPTSPVATITEIPSTPIQRRSLRGQVSRATISDAIPARRPSGSQNNAQRVASPEEILNKGSGPSSGGAINRQSSLRAKLSLPNLRKARNRSEDANDPAHGIFDRDANVDSPRDLVQVQDMQFELVRPNLAQLQIQARASSESFSPQREGSIDSRLENNGAFLRAASPAGSFLSSGPRSPVVETAPSPSTSMAMSAQTHSSVESTATIEAHRQREGKWVTLMSSSPAAVSRKSKKVKKLLLEGVPSSVRYLIWSYLTDGKGRAVKGVYQQLCKRGEVSKTEEISADVASLVQANGSTGHLAGVKDTVIILLQAYFAMVPDVQYSIGLVKIAGQLLVLAPEEDAFWIFTSIMDTHTRPYFSFTGPNPPTSSLNSNSFTRSTQLEVDASLFARALESNDAALSKKLLGDLSIPPGVICQQWFTSLFVGVFPPDYVHRIWDIFLYEGVPFLLRVALTLTLACRRFLITSKSDAQALAILARPPSSTLPHNPDALLTAALAVKLKDDDVRKQRLKMGSVVKRQTQASQSTVAQNGISLPRS